MPCCSAPPLTPRSPATSPRQEVAPAEVLRAAAPVTEGTSYGAEVKAEIEIVREIEIEIVREIEVEVEAHISKRVDPPACCPEARKPCPPTGCAPASATARLVRCDAPGAAPTAPVHHAVGGGAAGGGGAAARPRCYLYRVPPAATAAFAPTSRISGPNAHGNALNLRARTHTYACASLPPRAAPSQPLSSAAAASLFMPSRVRLLPLHLTAMRVPPLRTSPPFRGLVH